VMDSLVPGPDGTRFRIARYPPAHEVEKALGEDADVGVVLSEVREKLPGLAESYEAKDVKEALMRRMHTTDTVDYGIVISGEICLELDDGAQVVLKQGDCVIQNGTHHAWINRGTEPCLMAFVMIGAQRR